MRIPAVRFFAATVVALLVFVLAQGTVPRVEAVAVALFEPDPLFILDGRSGVLTVTVLKEVTQDEIDAGAIDVELVEPGSLSDTEIHAEDANIPAGTTAGDTIEVIVTFTIKCVNNEIEGTGEKSIAFEVEFGSTNSNALGSGTVTCSGKAIVIFDPNPLEVPEGSTKKVKVEITKELTAEEAFNVRIHVRLVEPGILDDTLLDTKDVKFIGVNEVGRKKIVTATFEISCTNNEIRGKLAGTGTDDAFKIATPGTCSTGGTACTITEIIDSTGDGGGNGLSLPFGIAVDGAGNVYVAGFFSDDAFKIATPGTARPGATP
ncbi:MAG: hypothetical protein IH863_01375, partial [Chloroflexi bacterium]|nr:hypothetical protein [Chloroflexota bacterium]